MEPSGCGASNVYIESRATAALYTYTPYQPNAAALSNMYGTGIDVAHTEIETFGAYTATGLSRPMGTYSMLHSSPKAPLLAPVLVRAEPLRSVTATQDYGHGTTTVLTGRAYHRSGSPRQIHLHAAAFSPTAGLIAIRQT